MRPLKALCSHMYVNAHKKLYCIISVSLQKTSHLFNNIFFFSSNYMFFINHAQQIKHQPSQIKAKIAKQAFRPILHNYVQ